MNTFITSLTTLSRPRFCNRRNRSSWTSGRNGAAPARCIAPILDDIAGQYAGRLKVAKINIDDNPTTPANFAVRGIPTLMLFKNGSVEATKVGALSKSQLVAFIDSHL